MTIRAEEIIYDMMGELRRTPPKRVARATLLQYFWLAGTTELRKTEQFGSFGRLPVVTA
jgi:hypothetical protein